MNPPRIIFDRVLKARQKKWAFSKPLFLLAAGGLRKEVELRLTEKIKVLLSHHQQLTVPRI